MPPPVFPPVFLRAFVSTIVPEAAALDDGRWADVEAAIEGVLQQRPNSIRRQLRMFLRVMQWLPLLRYGRRFTSLNPQQRAHFLSYFESHRLLLMRSGFWGVRTLALLGYYGRPEAAELIGYGADRRGWEAVR